MERKDTTISVRRDTYEDLDSFKSPGQSFDGVIRELLNAQKEEVEA